MYLQGGVGIFLRGGGGVAGRLGEDVGRDPVGGAAEAVVDARLVLLGARVPRRDDADEVPHAELVQHQRPTCKYKVFSMDSFLFGWKGCNLTRVSLARIFSSCRVGTNRVSMIRKTSHNFEDNGVHNSPDS